MGVGNRLEPVGVSLASIPYSLFPAPFARTLSHQGQTPGTSS